MATPDVPVAKWVGHPKSFTSGRKSHQPSVIVIHTTDGHEGPDDAENGAAYDKRRTDGTSTHYFVDSNSIVQEVEHKDESHAARTKGNDIGIQIEICGLAGQTSAQWEDAVSAATLENVAKLLVAIRRTGSYPLTRLSTSQLRSAWSSGSPRGICGHIDITNAFPEDNGTHTDPGKNFPWSKLFNRVKQLEGSVAPPRKVEILNFSVSLPALKEGDNDDNFPGYDRISRIQKIVGVTADGDWGPKTTAGIAAWCKVSTSAARTMTENLWREILGLS